MSTKKAPPSLKTLGLGDWRMLLRNLTQGLDPLRRGGLIGLGGVLVFSMAHPPSWGQDSPEWPQEGMGHWSLPDHLQGGTAENLLPLQAQSSTEPPGAPAPAGPPPVPEVDVVTDPVSPPEAGSGAEPEGSRSAIAVESVWFDTRNEVDRDERLNQFAEVTTRVRLSPNHSLSFKTGVNWFDQTQTRPVVNVPLVVGWTGRLDRVSLEMGMGAEVFDRLPTQFTLNAKAEGAVAPGVSLIGVVEHGPYKFNARTLENQVRTWRFGPGLYWQIDPQMFLYTQYRFGLYSDDNQEHQTFTRLERQFGSFFVSGNLFTWNYDQDLEVAQGYFSPPDFLVYFAEAGWDGKLIDPLSCRLAASVGQQRLRGNFELSYGFKARCTARLASRIEASLGYEYSNARESGLDNDYFNRVILGQLRVQF